MFNYVSSSILHIVFWLMKLYFRCPKSYNENYYLQNHIDRVHKKLKPFVCDLCGMSFTMKGSMKNHVTTVHKGIREHVCHECKYFIFIFFYHIEFLKKYFFIFFIYRWKSLWKKDRFKFPCIAFSWKGKKWKIY